MSYTPNPLRAKTPGLCGKLPSQASTRMESWGSWSSRAWNRKVEPSPWSWIFSFNIFDQKYGYKMDISFFSIFVQGMFFFEPLVHMDMMGKFTKHPQTKILKPVLVYLQEYKHWKHGRRSASGQWSPRGRSLNSSKSVFNLEGVLSNRRSPRTGRLSSSKYSWWIVSARPPGYALSKTQAQLGMIGWWWNTSGFSMLWWRYSV